MHKTILLIAMILIWIDLFFGIYHRFVQMPKWIGHPPASFGLIDAGSAVTKFFWETVSAFFLIAAVAGLIVNWNHHDARSHIIASLIWFLFALTLNFVYYMNKRLSIQASLDAAQTHLMVAKIKSWMRWTLVRDVMILIAAGFISIAWNHV